MTSNADFDRERIRRERAADRAAGRKLRRRRARAILATLTRPFTR